MRGSPHRPGVIVLVIAIGLIAAAVPCPDDLAVEAGAPDQCGTPRSPDDSTTPAPSVCPCVCHVAFGVTPAIRVAPGSSVAEVEFSQAASNLDAVPALISHPPLA
jgi:hypothetical protein